MHHIAGFANQLSKLGHSCIVAVPRNKQTTQCLREPCLFQPATFTDVLSIPNHFPNGYSADIVHAWTPREGVRRFVEQYFSKYSPRLIVHLEDNEAHILESFYGRSSEELAQLDCPPGFHKWVDELSHPINWKAFCSVADASTAIISDLFQFAAPDRPKLELLPGVSPHSPASTKVIADKKRSLGIPAKTKVIAYTGGISSSNRKDIRSLYLAIKILNDQGYPTRLIKTGPSDPHFASSFTFDINEISIDLGIVEKHTLPLLLDCSDLLVQPGEADTFNKYRLPSKLPEFLASGKPVIATAANIVLRMRDGIDCIYLKTGSPEEIAQHCIHLFNTSKPIHSTPPNGQAFALETFSIQKNTDALLNFYQQVIEAPAAIQRTGNSRLSTYAERKKTLQPANESSVETELALSSFIDKQALENEKNVAQLTQLLKVKNSENEALKTELKEQKNALAECLSRRHLEFLAANKSIAQLQTQIIDLKQKSTKTSRGIARFQNALTAPFRQKNTQPIPEKVPESFTKTPAPAYKDYSDFCRRLQPLIDEYEQSFLERKSRLKYQAKISILLPVYNAPKIWLEKAIDSVRQQSYDNWELCIADDCSTLPHVKETIDRHTTEDTRIKAIFRQENGHISNASNTALSMASGDFVALLDHDDELPSHALARIVDRLQIEPGAKIIYSDEDKINTDGKRFDPHFKSDWNLDLLLGQNYINHFCTYSRVLLNELDGFRTGFEGAQDWDLLLRASERCREKEIVHIPEVLYHWRAIDGSTAHNLGDKDYAYEAGKRALKSYLDRKGIQATLHPIANSYWRVQYPIPQASPKVSIIIPTRDRLDLLKPCVESILEKTSYSNFEIVIVDNDSTEESTLRYFDSITGPNIRILKICGPFNFNALNNAAIKSVSTEIVCLMNNDITVISEGWLEELVSHALRIEVGIVGPKLLFPHDHVQHAGVILGIGTVASEAFKGIHKDDDGYIHRACLTGNFSALTAACMLFRKNIWQEIGCLDEVNTPNAFGDIDFCLRAREAGYRCVFTPHAQLYHHESASRGSDLDHDKIEAFKAAVSYMKKRWHHSIENDPYYNPNLTFDRADFTLTFPPRAYPTK